MSQPDGRKQRNVSDDNDMTCARGTNIVSTISGDSLKQIRYDILKTTLHCRIADSDVYGKKSW